MGEIRLSKLMRQFQMGLDDLVSYLDEMGVKVEKVPNAKIPEDVLPLLRNRVAQGKEQQVIPNNQEHIEKESVAEPAPERQHTYVIDPSLPKEIKTQAKEMGKTQIELLKLVEGMRIGKMSAPYLNKNKRILSSLVSYAQDHPEHNEAIQSFVDSLSKELYDQIVAYRSGGGKKKARIMKTDFIISLRNQYLAAVSDMIPDEILDTFEVGWDKVVFQDGRLLLDIGQVRKLACPLHQSRQTYNLFRDAFIQRVPPLQVRIHSKKSPEIINSVEFQEVFEYLQIRDDIRLGMFSRRLDLAKFLVKSKVNFQDTFLTKDRGPYIQFLVEKQAPDYRFIPVFEKALDREDAYLFTLKGTRLYVVWENINENTATYVFPVGKESYEKVLQAIYDYASSETDYKRMRMHYGQSAQIMGVNCRILYHNDLNQWKREISSLVR